MLGLIARFVGNLIIIALILIGLDHTSKKVMGWKDDSDRIRSRA